MCGANRISVHVTYGGCVLSSMAHLSQEYLVSLLDISHTLTFQVLKETKKEEGEGEEEDVVGLSPLTAANVGNPPRFGAGWGCHACC